MFSASAGNRSMTRPGERRIIIYHPSLTLRANVTLARSVSEGWHHLQLASRLHSLQGGLGFLCQRRSFRSLAQRLQQLLRLRAADLLQHQHRAWLRKRSGVGMNSFSFKQGMASLALTIRVPTAL